MNAFDIDVSAFTNNNAVVANFYVWRNGGDINLTYVPEPASLGVLALSGVALRRRRIR
jgi:hypothetical protein